jgi:CheY-like chemotaxis protein
MNPSRSVLLVEDDTNDILLMQRAFQKANLNIGLKVVCDGDAAVAYLSHFLAREHYDPTLLPLLILLDLKLPRRSGLEVLAWIRQQTFLRRIPVVILTSSSQNPDICQAYELNVNSYLIKPVNFNDLVHLVEMVKRYWLELNTSPLSLTH